MSTFNQKISYQIQDSVESLCEFKASCIGSGFKLDKDIISFGSIIIGCASQKQLALHNIGDIGGRFKWLFYKPQQNFTITPNEGYISPNTVVAFTVKYKPIAIARLYEAKAKCCIEDYTPLELTLTGSCIHLPHPQDTIKFVCPVRETDKKSIVVENTSGEVWNLKPMLKGEFFTVSDVFSIEPLSSGNCEILYSPLLMTSTKLHEASILFNLPEGKSIYYHLIGTSQPPPPVETITKEIMCKTYHTETLNVHNWLKTTQNFKVITKSTLPFSVTKKTLYKLTGNDTIEVLGESERDYTWTIYVLNQGVLNFKVTFKNPATNEYLYYVIALTVIGECPPLEYITLTTCVRIPIVHILKLQNLIKSVVVFSITSTTTELSFDSPVTVKPYSEHEVQVKYLPLSVGTAEHTLNIITNELGTYTYNFMLTSRPPVPEQPLTFTADLGQTTTAQATLFNFTNVKVDFGYQIHNPDIFYLNNSVTIGPQEKGIFEITFDPNSVSTRQSTLILTSAITGPYIFPLIGTCNLPKPQGPYFVSPGNSTPILFRNPFNVNHVFKFAVEPAIFSLKGNSEEVKSKRDVKIMVNLAPLKNLEILIDRKYPITGKLSVQCTEPKLSFIKWIFYLQGDV